ncbi:M28 family peptidase [soil metagenome]
MSGTEKEDKKDNEEKSEKVGKQEMPTAEELASAKRAKLNSIISLIIAGICGYLASMLWMPGNSYSGDTLRLSDKEKVLCQNLRNHVEMLAGTIGERNIRHYAQLEQAAKYIEDSFAKAGYVTKAQVYDVLGDPCRNIEVEIRGEKYPNEIVVLGAHYDSAPTTPGADDNASGVASLLELARLLKGRKFDRTIRLVSFPNEEPPYFRTTTMGSYHYAEAAHKRGDKIIGMLALETMGTYSNEPGSQHYPVRGGTLFYPNKGNFIAFVASQSSSAFNRECIGAFRRLVDFPSEGFSLPSFIIGVNYSDDWSFQKFDFPAVMVTDTAPFRIDTYHRPSDLPNTLDYDNLTRVVSGISSMVGAVAGEQ